MMNFNGGSAGSPQNRLRNFFNNRKNLSNTEQPPEVSFDDDFTKCGMVNLMNNCYLNSIIQLVCNVPEIKDYVLQIKEDVLFSRADSKEERACKEFLKIAKVLHDSFESAASTNNFNKITTNKEVTPVFFIQSMAAIDSQYDSNEQCDAQEFFLCLINSLIDGVKPMIDGGLPALNADKKGNIFESVFQGTVANRISCVNCGKCTTLDETFYDISLSMPENNISLKLIIQNMYDYERNMPKVLDIKIRLFHESKVSSLFQTIAPIIRENGIDISNIRILTQNNSDGRLGNEGISTVANKETLLIDCINFNYLFIMAIDFGGLAKNGDFFYAVDHYFLKETDYHNFPVTKEFLSIEQPNTLMFGEKDANATGVVSKSQNALVKDNITGMFNKLSTFVKSSLKRARYEVTDEQRLVSFFNKNCSLLYAPLVMKISKSTVAENQTKDTCIVKMIKKALPQLAHLKERLNYNLFDTLFGDDFKKNCADFEINYRVLLFMNNKTRYVINSNLPFSIFPTISALKVVYYVKPNSLNTQMNLDDKLFPVLHNYEDNISVSSEKISKMSLSSSNITGRSTLSPTKKVNVDNKLDQRYYANNASTDLLIDLGIDSPTNTNTNKNTNNTKGYEVNLVDTLKAHFNEKTLLEGRECPNCKQRSTSEMSYSLKTLPKVFVCHLKKFEYLNNGQKLEFKMDLPGTINVADFILPENQTANCTYKLFGMVCHRGTYANGHYVSVIRDHRNQKWKCYDDERMSYIEDSSTLITLSPYLIFYTKE